MQAKENDELKDVPQTLTKRLAAVLLTVMIAVNVGMIQATPVALAASLTSVTDTMTSQAQGADANHTITFTTPSGAGDDETITLTFATDFVTATLTEDDVDITDDDVQLTTASDCSGAEQASVAIADDVVTITICALDGGAIAAGSIVKIFLGTNAVNSGVGLNQITNPVGLSNYLIAIGGTFGDTGSVVVATTEVGSIDVNLTVEQDSGSGGSGGSGYIPPAPESHGDTTAPTILDVDVSDITTTTAVISWSTDEDTTCSVDYGETESYGDSVSESSSGTSHSVELSGLSSDTEYFFLITCEDESSNVSTEGPASFTTETDSAPANISGFMCEAGDEQIDFSWIMPSDEDLAGVYINCNTGSYPSSSSEGTNVFTGGASATSASASGFINDTLYYCTGFSFDEAGNEASGAIDSCRPVASEEEEVLPEEEPVEEIPTEETPTEETPTDEPSAGQPTTVEPSVESEETIPSGTTPTSTETSEETVTETESDSSPEIPSGPETASGSGIQNSDLSFVVEGGSIELSSENDSVDVIPGTTLTIRVPASAVVNQAVAEIYLTIGDSTFLLGAEMIDDQIVSYDASITTPLFPGIYAAGLRMVFTDGTTQDVDFAMQAVDMGYVYETVDRAVSRVSGAAVSLLQSVGGAWSLADLSTAVEETNPTVSAEDGTFAWYTQNGTYKVEASKSGYNNGTSSVFTVSNNIATTNVLIVKQPEPIDTIIVPTTIIGSIAEQVSETLESIREIPEVQTGTDIAIPTAVVLGTVATTVLVTSFDLVPLLHYLTTVPFLFFSRRKRKAWGVVYNAATKLPVDLAIVRLYKMPENHLIATRVTDKEGRYFFLTSDGEYRLEALKPTFSFPTVLVHHLKTDGDFLDVYHGESIIVKEKDATIAANIPIDPGGDGRVHMPSQIVKRRLFRRLTISIAPVGLALALGIAILRPSALTIGGFAIQFFLLLVSLRLAKPRKPKSWGIVYDAGDSKPVAGTVVRIFEPLYNKLLETAITDNRGRYSFLVGPSTYFTTYEKAGYNKQEVRPIDFTQKKEVGEIAIDVTINKITPQPQT